VDRLFYFTEIVIKIKIFASQLHVSFRAVFLFLGLNLHIHKQYMVPKGFNRCHIFVNTICGGIMVRFVVVLVRQ
jgi:hypothetical protein